MALPVFQAAGTAVSLGEDELVAIPWPAHQADDIGLLIIESEATIDNFALEGFVETADSPQTQTGTHLRTFWKRATGAAEPNPVGNEVNNHAHCRILTFRGCITTGNPWDVTAGNTAASSTSVSVPGDTTTVAECLIVNVCSRGNDVGTAQFSAWANADLSDVTERSDTGTTEGTGGGFGVATGGKATAGLFGATTATLAAAAVQNRIMIALKPPAAAGQTIAVGQVTETDLASAIVWAPKHRLVNQVVETDLAQVVVRLKTALVGQVTESDLAQAIAINPIHRLVQQVLETDTAFVITVVTDKVIVVNQVTESDLAQVIAWAPKHRLVGQVLETDNAFIIVPVSGAGVPPEIMVVIAGTAGAITLRTVIDHMTTTRVVITSPNKAVIVHDLSATPVKVKI